MEKENCTRFPLAPLLERWTDCVNLAISSFALLFGVFGNLAVVLIVARNPKLRTTPNVLITNLAVSDVLFLLIHVPSSSLPLLSPDWTTTSMCKMAHAVRYVTLGGTIFTLVALSADRYFAIAQPMSERRGHSKKYIIRLGLVVIWSLSLVFSVPISVGADVHRYKYRFGNSSCVFLDACKEIPSDWGLGAPTAAASVKFTVFYAVPGFAIFVFYSSMAYMLWHSSYNMPGESAATRHRQLLARRKLAEIVMVMTAIFFVAWLPSYVSTFCFVTKAKCNNEKLRLVARIFCYVCSCCNPMTLLVLSKQYREHFMRLICVLDTRPGSQFVSHDTGTGSAVQVEQSTKLSHHNQPMKKLTIRTTCANENSLSPSPSNSLRCNENYSLM